MADVILFDEGAAELLASGLPATAYFGLSTKVVDPTAGGTAYVAGETLASVGEITGTGYGRTSEAEPALVGGAAAYPQQEWATGAAEDWPADARSCFMATSADGTGKLLCAWNLRAGGLTRDLSAASTTERFTPTVGPLSVA